MGPSERAGRTGEGSDDDDDADSRAPKSVPSVGNVPAEGGIAFLPTIDPAIAITGTIIKKRRRGIPRPASCLYQSVLALSRQRRAVRFPALLNA